MKDFKDNSPVSSFVDGGVLFVQDLFLSLHIGVGEQERSEPQDISISYEVAFSSKPVGCKTDSVADIICYDSLSNKIVAYCSDREFNLIESLCQQVLQVIKSEVGENRVKVIVRKWPQVRNLQGSVSFTLSG